MIMSDFDIKIKHVSGKSNVVADLLSRMDFSETLAEVEIEEFPLLAGYLSAAQRNDIVLGTVFNSL